jgi:thiamine pyrophosphokinase
VLAGELMEAPILHAWAESADVILAADGGANYLVELGLRPDIAVGDFDSISPDAKAAAKTLIHIEDQNYSDCDKLLRLVSENGWRAVTLIGAEGGRVDHVLGILQSAARADVGVFIAYRQQFGAILRGPVRASFKVAGKFSLMSIYDCHGVDLTGARWPLEGAEFSIRSGSSLSNEAEERIEVSIESGAAILLHGYDGLPYWPDTDRLSAQ